MGTWIMCAQVGWHRARGHTVTRGGNPRITRRIADGFTFVIPPVFNCSCGAAWEGNLAALVKHDHDHSMPNKSFEFRQRADDD